MKRLLLSIFLLVVLVVISYIQVIRETDRRSDAFERGRAAGERQADLDLPDYDSLTALIDSQQSRLSRLETERDSILKAEDSKRTALVDSLTGQIDHQRAELTGLRRELDSVKTSMKRRVKTASSDKASHSEILGYYRKEIQRLPSDLSTYEKRVAVSEIRTETAARFSITVDRLNEIRHQYNLDY